MAEIVRGATSLEAGRALIDAANDAGGRDNITVVLFRLEDVEARAARPRRAPPPRTDEWSRRPCAAAPARASRRRAPAARAEEAHGRGAAKAPAAAHAPRSPAARPRRGAAPRPPPSAAAASAAAASAVGLVASRSSLSCCVGAWIATQTVYFVGAARTTAS